MSNSRLATVARQCGVAALLAWHAAREDDGIVDAREAPHVEARFMDWMNASIAADEADGFADSIRQGIGDSWYFREKLGMWRAAVDELPDTAA
jgi:hypothetical protein